MRFSLRLLFLLMLLFHLSFYLIGLLLGKTVFEFASEANTDGVAYFNIALNPLDDPPVDSGFRYATFLYPLIVSLVARGDPFITAVTMEMINILAFSISIVFFYQISKLNGHSIATVFYAFNPILLISTHGGMNEPLYFALVFGALLRFYQEKFLSSSILLSIASIARPDFLIFILPYFAFAKSRRFLPYLILVLATMTGFGYYLISRFTFEHFLSFASGSGSELPPQLGIPFGTFFYNRFFGAEQTFQIVGVNLAINEIISWTIFAGIMISILFMVTKKQFDGFSLSLIILGSVIQPAYSFFSGYFRFISMAPHLYKIPSLLIRNKGMVYGLVVVYFLAGSAILVGWFF